MTITRNVALAGALTLAVAGHAAPADIMVPQERTYSYVPAQREYIVTQPQTVVTERTTTRYVVTEPAPVPPLPRYLAPPRETYVAPYRETYVAPYRETTYIEPYRETYVPSYRETYVEPYRDTYVVQRPALAVDAPAAAVTVASDIDAYAGAPRCTIDSFGYRRCY